MEYRVSLRILFLLEWKRSDVMERVCVGSSSRWRTCPCVSSRQQADARLNPDSPGSQAVDERERENGDTSTTVVLASACAALPAMFEGPRRAW